MPALEAETKRPGGNSGAFSFAAGAIAKAIAAGGMAAHHPAMRSLDFRFPAVAMLILLGSCQAQPERYAHSCATPVQGWLTPAQGIGHLMRFESVQITAPGQILWNGQPVDMQTFSRYMAEVSSLPEPAPQITLSIHPATDCHVVREVRARMVESPICRKRLCGEGNGWRDYDGTALPDP